MRFKIGDKLKCIRPSFGNDRVPELEFGKIYSIDSITDIGCGYYSINNWLFYSKEDKQEYYDKLKPIKHGDGGSIGVQGISPSDDIDEFFISLRELRKEKLEKINGMT